MAQSLEFMPKISQSGPNAVLYMNRCCKM